MRGQPEISLRVPVTVKELVGDFHAMVRLHTPFKALHAAPVVPNGATLNPSVVPPSCCCDAVSGPLQVLRESVFGPLLKPTTT